MSNDVIYLSNVRVSWPHLAEPQEKVDATTNKKTISYNCELLMAPDHTGFQQFMQRYGALALEKTKENAAAVMQMLQADRKSRCFGSGDEKIDKKTFKPYTGYAGNVYITVGNRSQPQMIQADGSQIDPLNTMLYQQMARRIYGGCRVNVAIKPWWQNPNPAKQYGHGVRCDLIAIQFHSDDVAFGEAQVDGSGLFGAVAQTAPTFAAPAQMPAAPFPGAGVPGLPPFMTGR